MSSQRLMDRAKAVLEANWVGDSTVPSRDLYPHQWSWDSAFIAIGRGWYDQARAERELERLFEARWANGMLPHIVFNAAVPEDAYFPGPRFWHRSGPPPPRGPSGRAASPSRRFTPGPRSRSPAARFDARRYWRWPIWLNTNWLLWRGLRRHGRDQLADEIAASSIGLIEGAGFREYFDPFGGAGHGSDDFAWSAALLIDFVMRGPSAAG